MTKIEAYEIDDQFDPLEDLTFEDELNQEEDEGRHDYLPPIPDAELSVVPEEVPLSPEEAINKLIAGMPGQKQRLLYAVQVCTTPQRLEDIVEAVDESFPHPGVYGSAQLVKLLEKAGALSSVEIEQEETDEEPVTADEAVVEGDEEEYLTVSTPPVYEYTATEDGLKAVEDHIGESRVIEVITEEERYLPLYRTILEMTSVEGGCATKDLDAVIDPDPLCVEPKRFCGYFLDRLEESGAVKWQRAWVATETGAKLLETDLFTTGERS